MQFKWFEKRKYIPETLTLEVEMPEDITDEIEKSLLELKDAYDLPTEEVEISIETRKQSIEKFASFKFSRDA
tara:strand:- start:291 stop:506 length:216 start_codon:yes stop_codon:yes gene_type:complete